MTSIYACFCMGYVFLLDVNMQVRGLRRGVDNCRRDAATGLRSAFAGLRSAFAGWHVWEAPPGGFCAYDRFYDFAIAAGTAE